MRDRPSGSARASTSAVPDDEDSMDESEIMSSLSRIESRLDQLLTTQAHHTPRLDHLEQNFELAGYPWYDFAYRSHMVGESMASPFGTPNMTTIMRYL